MVLKQKPRFQPQDTTICDALFPVEPRFLSLPHFSVITSASLSTQVALVHSFKGRKEMDQEWKPLRCFERMWAPAYSEL
jgi:hypothetical protein